ncbi:MAG: exodeoxyribonuclease VII small subunit [Candidatus Marinimicrobia bacterium]|jgi:exodeoxyribonuclease VII small subunit|nr:exodeoxyribonuclease VII small subunit [Candidatus Neomarinimicrobiota bacterium]MBT3676257.1 exodeoxyribonuclease VII small subunit [Candidatus Neomarinimicrobiota bacterium]MBT3763140.1 exodeoxyribonuclease VII small subunit [Candidatus Neomarinimicrobiota bacterium]MBT4068940.1 exodeoxyribonuclease VII small subunit [Candidatus Neomarinimicrobiota bacterium]MBT4270833.1 exodeoxyribonuclease VII small subunit [Candidatus Neomarinimicrobiota bacterium]
MSKQKTFEFEAVLGRLEKIVESLEGESESLEKSLTLFEEGVKLTDSLKDHLESAEQQIKVLMKDTDGKVKTEDFEG